MDISSDIQARLHSIKHKHINKMGNMNNERERLTAEQNYTINTNYIKVKVDTQQNCVCRLCRQSDV